jgi:photosystem II stability/assembly factor-like uncharacterized protein
MDGRGFVSTPGQFHWPVRHAVRGLVLTVMVGALLPGCEGPPAVPPPDVPDDGAGPPHRAALIHRPSPGRAPEPGASGWVREHPAHTGGLLTALAPWGRGVAVGTSDGEIFEVTPGGEWKRLGPRRNVAIVAICAASDRALYVLDADGAVLKTVDGQVFTQVKAPPTLESGEPRVPGLWRPYRSLHARRIKGKDSVVVAGLSQHVAFSRDGGASWVEEALGGPETLRASYIDARGTLSVAGGRGRVFLRAVSDQEWGKAPIPQKPVVVWLGEVGNDGALWASDAGGSIRIKRRTGQWDLVRSAAGAIRSLVDVGQDIYGASQSGSLTLFRADRAGLLSPAETWQGDRRPLEHVVRQGEAVWAAGPEQLLYRGSDGEWTSLRGRVTQTLAAVSLVGDRRGFAVGRGGLLLRRHRATKSTGGVQWTPVAVVDSAGEASRRALHDVVFAGGRFGWTVDGAGQLGRTQDGGRSWTSSSVDGVSGPLTKLAALDPVNLFAAGNNGLLLASGDRGVTWRDLGAVRQDDRPEETTALVLERSDKDARVLAASARGTLWETVLGRREVVATHFPFVRVQDLASADGVSWMLDATGSVFRRARDAQEWQLVSVSESLSFADVTFSSHGDLGLLLATTGSMFRTEDGGLTWYLVTSGPRRAPGAVAHAGGDVFVVVGHGGEVQRSQDRGKTWSRVPLPSGRTFSDVELLGSELVAVGVRGAAYSSRDRGMTWTRWVGAPGDVGTTHLTRIAQGDDGRAALGGIGSVWVREPTGQWTRLAESGSAGSRRLGEVRALRLGEGQSMAVVTASGALWRRTGATLSEWSGAGPPGTHSKTRWFDLSGASGRVVGVTNHGVVSVTLGEKAVWARERLVSSAAAMPAGLGRDGERLWLLGSGGLWAKDGLEWKQVISALPTRPVALEFSSHARGFAVGAGGRIYSTTDGGLQWVAEATGTRTDLSAVGIGRDGRALAVGAGGVILRRVGR